MSPPDVLRFTLPSAVADAIDLDAIERLAIQDDIPRPSYKAYTTAGIEHDCSIDFAALLVGATSDAAAYHESAAVRQACADFLTVMTAQLARMSDRRRTSDIPPASC